MLSSKSIMEKVRTWARVVSSSKENMTSNPTQRLNAEEWGEIARQSEMKDILDMLAGKTSPKSWTLEMMKLTQTGERVLEIGCGSGQTSLYLAQNGRRVTALDYAPKSIELVQSVAARAGIGIETIQADAMKPLPFDENSFDVIFQAGLLEHFSQEERIGMLSTWAPYTKRMVSMIPNAHSLAYRLGKKISEQNGTWPYGLEMPQPSLLKDFMEAGFKNVQETSIGLEDALQFLPKHHYLRNAIERWRKEMGEDSDLWGQGYLLVTVGEK